MHHRRYVTLLRIACQVPPTDTRRIAKRLISAVRWAYCRRVANFGEDDQSEVRTIHLPRTRVNGLLSSARRGEALRGESSILYLQMEPLFAHLPVRCPTLQR